jgi:hypothetical protein
VAKRTIPKEEAIVFEDYTLEQGIKYKYAIQRYNDNGVRSKRKMADKIIQAYFDDMFLYDGKMQLRVAFNPKVSSFKSTILETKTNTMGGKYPFFFRNGDVNYKEFPVSGLISVNMD